MNELDRIYEDIEKLLEAGEQVNKDATAVNKEPNAPQGSNSPQTPQEPVASQESAAPQENDSPQNSSSSIKDTEDATLDLLGEYEGKLSQSNQTIQQLQAQVAEIQKSLQTAAPQDKKNLENQEAQAEAQLAQAQKEKENAEEQINQAKESDNTEGTNNSVNLNHRFNDVIESPQIQAEINKEQEPITSIEISDGGNNQQKISIMGEKYSTPIEIPEFISRYFEAKELSSLNAGNSTSLNPYFSKEIQTQLASQGKEITKLLLSTDGEVLFLDKTGRQIMIDKPEEHPEKEGETSQNDPNNGREISHAVTVTELNALAGPINSKLSNLKKSLSESISKSLGNYKCEFTELKLGKVLEGTYLNESKIHEASDNPKKEEKEEKETAVPKKETSGDCEVYVMGEFNIRSNELTESTEKELDKILNEALETIRFKESDDITEEKSDNTDVEGSDSESPESSEVSENKNEGDQNTTEEPEENKDDDSKMEETVTNILTLSEKSIIDALNKAGNGITSLSNKTKDEGTFTGNSKQITSFSYAPGQESRTGFEATGENNGVYSFKSWFTIIIKKGNSKDSFGTGLNKFGQMLTGIGDMSAKLGMNGKSGLNSVTL